MIRTLLILSLSLLQINAWAQIPAGYYDGTDNLTGNALKNKLNDIIDNHTELSYNALKTALKNTDEDPNNSSNVILLYKGTSQSKSSFGGGANDWNREHVWAKSHGGFGNSKPVGTDLHHIRPTDASVNSSRGSLDFDNGGNAHNEATQCKFDGDSWEPRDAVKGDVARMLFYMAVRYEGESGEVDLELNQQVNNGSAPYHGKLSTLLQWHAQDPVDAFETNRNNEIYGYQNNRNPFVDHPEFANKIWNPVSVEEYEPTLWFYDQNHLLSLVNEQAEIRVFDVLGKQVLPVKKQKVSLESIQSGVYFVRIQEGKNSFYLKINKQ
ncbi:MAG: endonuclease [Flavobacteriales bacterium]|jgi:endonuclease I|nr:endonuclease [Flavobacteriales bacterium]